ncbi:MAG: DUF47 domain-containing protein [Cellulosilyticaceae bacterium]
MSRKKEYDYFGMFVESVEYACDAATMLHNTLKNFRQEDLADKMEAMHKIEHTADHSKHEMMKELIRAFITPIEREDIMELAQEIDDVTDSIEDVLMRVYMFNIKTIRPEALAFTEVIEKCCNALKTAMEELPNFKKSDLLGKSIVQINYYEEMGDTMYKEAMHKLYSTETDPIEVMAWSEMFNRLEKCCDTCEHVANVIETIVMKNS